MVSYSSYTVCGQIANALIAWDDIAQVVQVAAGQREADLGMGFFERHRRPGQQAHGVALPAADGHLASDGNGPRQPAKEMDTPSAAMEPFSPPSSPAETETLQITAAGTGTQAPPASETGAVPGPTSQPVPSAGAPWATSAPGEEAQSPSAPEAETIPVPEQTAPPAESEEPQTTEEVHEMKLTLTIGGQTFSATLLDNETARAFFAQLTLTLDMSELNGNEKYFYMDGSLPTNASCPGQIKAGDLMLFGDNCLVLFYESFSTSYSYTRLGQLDDPAGLAAALGRGDAAVEFSVSE